MTDKFFTVPITLTANDIDRNPTHEQMQALIDALTYNAGQCIWDIVRQYRREVRYQEKENLKELTNGH